MNDVADSLALLMASRRPVVLSGAGISVSAGLSTYRGDDGLWTNDPLADAHSHPPPAKLNDPELRRAWWDGVWSLWGPMRAVVERATPSEAHAALARWEDHVEEMLVVTQNIDGLHQRAGSKHVVELHGSLLHTRCSRRRCSERPRADLAAHVVSPSCARCGRPERPDVVLFSEGLDTRSWDQVSDVLGRADLLVVVGSSGVVSPANHLVTMVEGHFPIVRVDPGSWLGPAVTFSSEFSGTADELFRGLWKGE